MFRPCKGFTGHNKGWGGRGGGGYSVPLTEHRVLDMVLRATHRTVLQFLTSTSVVHHPLHAGISQTACCQLHAGGLPCSLLLWSLPSHKVTMTLT